MGKAYCEDAKSGTKSGSKSTYYLDIKSRRMKKLNNEQSEWFKKNFCIRPSQMPSDFYDRKDFIELICGRGVFRGKDHQGESMSFAEDCFMSLTACDSNIAKFELLFKQLHNHWTPEALAMEYYELLANLKVLHGEFERFVTWVNIHEEDMAIRSLLFDVSTTHNA